MPRRIIPTRLVWLLLPYSSRVGFFPRDSVLRVVRVELVPQGHCRRLSLLQGLEASTAMVDVVVSYLHHVLPQLGAPRDATNSG